MAEATQKTRKIEDAGEKIGGARKDWKDRAMSVADLAEMTSDEAVEQVKKDHIWPQPKWEEVVAAGMPAEIAARVKLLRDRMAQTPTFRRENIDPAFVREAFVRMTSRVRDAAMASRTVADFERIESDIIAGFGPGFRSDSHIREEFFSIAKFRTSPISIDFKDRSKARTMVREGFPGKAKPWLKGVTFYPAPGGAMIAVKAGRPISPPFTDDEKVMEFLETQYNQAQMAIKAAKKANAGTEEDKKPTAPERPHLDVLERSGLADVRGGRDISPDDFLETFGFRGVEFGNWLPDGERQQVLNIAYDALNDLATVLGVDPDRISLDGSLAIAFGARGKGKALAHYEPGRKVLNMTRLRGAGSVAHEWGHALDHWAGELGANGTSSRHVPSGTGWDKDVGAVEQKRRLMNLSDEQSLAWVKTVGVMRKTALTVPEAMENRKSRLEELTEKIKRHQKMLDDQMALEPAARDRKFVRDLNKFLEDMGRRKDAVVASISDLENGLETFLGSRTSDYMTEAMKLCGSSGEYWKRPNELFARAFESYVFDKLDRMDARSDYLVHGVEGDRYAGEEYKGNPYPSGDERLAINGEIDDLIAAMRPRLAISPEAPRP